LVEGLVKPETQGGVLTQEQAATWKANLQRLVQQGGAGVSAIREFLSKNQDLDFGEGGRQLLGYASVRGAMLDALFQIGGPEAISAMTSVLGTTADPHEIAVLAQNLEKLAPATHRQEALEAARQTLAMAAQGNLPGQDVAPLFEVFQNYGDANTVAELTGSAKEWNYYSMIALAQLPEGAGIPALVQLIQGEGGLGSGSRTAALKMLAQAAGQSEAARAALLDQARQSKLTPYNWATLEPVLAGNQVRFQDSAFGTQPPPGSDDVRQTHIASGNQNFYTAPPAGGLTLEHINQQTALIDELFKATTDQAAVGALQRARAALSQRQARMTAVGGQ
jgi:hypothetical protein